MDKHLDQPHHLQYSTSPMLVAIIIIIIIVIIIIRISITIIIVIRNLELAKAFATTT